MQAKVVKQFQGVPDGQVMPRLFQVGDIVTGDLARAALADGSAAVIGADAVTPPPPAAETAGPAPRRAKTLRQVTIEDDGKPVKIAKGSIVEGDLADRLVAEGAAIEIKDKGPAPESK